MKPINNKILEIRTKKNIWTLRLDLSFRWRFSKYNHSIIPTIRIWEIGIFYVTRVIIESNKENVNTLRAV